VTSRRQIAANRRNAKKSTGPRTIAGKLRSRATAVQHGLTGETVITVFENTAEFEALQRLLISQYRPRSAIERQLVLRLSSLLWRLRRAAAIETGLFHIQGRIIADRRAERVRRDDSQTGAKPTLHEMLKLTPSLTIPSANVSGMAFNGSASDSDQAISTRKSRHEPTWTPRCGNKLPPILAQCFMRVARLDNHLFDRLGRYETALWRQTAEVIRMLSSSR
jgi:hypothetical protein